jgi:hypothetical protein
MVKTKTFYVYFHYDTQEDDTDEELEHGYVRNDQVQGFEGTKIEDFCAGMKASVLVNSKGTEIWRGTIVDFDGKCD